MPPWRMICLSLRTALTALIVALLECCVMQVGRYDTHINCVARSHLHRLLMLHPLLLAPVCVRCFVDRMLTGIRVGVWCLTHGIGTISFASSLRFGRTTLLCFPCSFQLINSNRGGF
uniref:Putative secreted protein n=1 Tax=Anopheles darlingi TaxID=43151 RepID=A0A2M4DRS7_ANODA